MPKGDGTTLEKLFIELGLDLSRLQSDILAADRTVTENISRLNRERNIIRLRMEADTAGLDRVKDAAKIFEIQEKSLNQQLTISRDRMTILEAAYKQVANNANATAVAVNRAEQAFLREKVIVGQLEQELRTLSSQKVSPPPVNNLLSGYQGLKGNVTDKLSELNSAFSQLQGSTSSVDTAITATLGVIGSIPRPAALATAALVGLPLIFKGIENSILDMTKAAAAGGDSVYVMSRGFQMSIADTGKFSTNAKVAGVQVNDLATAVKNVQRQVARGGEDSRAAEWLKRYGESAYDASGNLKNLNEMTFALSRALKRAQADGKGAEFVLNAFRNVSADAITAIEDWADVSAQASTIVKAGLGNPKLAHEVQGNLNAMNVQSAQLGTSFTNALLPVANEIVPRMTERMGKMTSLIRENKDVILDLGRDFAQVWGAVEDTVDKVVDGMGVLAKLARDNRVVRQSDTKSVVDKYKADNQIKNARDILEREIATGGYSDEDVKKLRLRNDLYLKELKRAEEDSKALWAKRREDFAEEYKSILEKYKGDKDIKIATDLMNKLTDSEKDLIKQDTSTFFNSFIEKIGALTLELIKLRETADTTSGSLEKLSESSKVGGLRGIKGDTSPDISEDVRKAYEEEWKKTRALNDELYKITHDEYENKIFDLNKWHAEMVNGVESSHSEMETIEKLYAAKSTQIEQERANKLQEIRDSVAAAEKNSFDNKLANIDKEKESWIQVGMGIVEAEELAQKKRLKVMQDAAEKAQQYLSNAADIEFSLTHTALEKQIRDIERWEEAQKKKADTAEEISGIVANAAAKEAEAFEREVDRIKGKVQSLEDKIFEQEHSQYANDLRRLQQERIKLYQEGIYSPSLIERYYQNALGKLSSQAMKGGDYTKAPEGVMQRGGNGIMVIEGDQIIDDGLIRGQQQEIQLLADENRIRAQVAQGLNLQARALIGNIQSTNALADAQRQFAGQTQQTGGGYDIIEGDQVVNRAQSPKPSISGYQVIEGDQIVAMPITEQLQQFGSVLDSQRQQLAQFGGISATTANNTMTFETVVTPLNNIATILSDIRGQVSQPAQITVSPTITVDLGGAYVFDDALKAKLTDDITSEIVDNITNAVRQATSNKSYSYGA